jgi:hypothetical protein
MRHHLASFRIMRFRRRNRQTADCKRRQQQYEERTFQHNTQLSLPFPKKLKPIREGELNHKYYCPIVALIGLRSSPTFRQIRTLPDNVVQTTGRVVSLVPKNSALDFQYNVGGATFRNRGKPAFPNPNASTFHIGDQITVFYDRTDRKFSALMAPDAFRRKVVSPVIIIGVLICGIAALIVTILPKPKKSRRNKRL